MTWQKKEGRDILDLWCESVEPEVNPESKDSQKPDIAKEQCEEKTWSSPRLQDPLPMLRTLQCLPSISSGSKELSISQGRDSEEQAQTTSTICSLGTSSSLSPHKEINDASEKVALTPQCTLGRAHISGSLKA